MGLNAKQLTTRIRKVNLRHYDFWIFMATFALLVYGLLILFSASAPNSASRNGGDAFALFRSQLRFAGIGFAAMLLLTFVPYRLWGKLAPLAMAASFLALLLVFVPGFSVSGSGTRRWLDVGPISFQPSEVAKFALIVFLSASLAKRRGVLSRYWKGLLPYLLVVAAFAGLVVIEPHVSGAVFILSIGLCVLFAAGAKIWHFAATAAVVAPLGFVAIEFLPLPEYVQKRVDSFFNLGADALDKDWQVMQSLYAIGSGGLFGKGLTKSTQKFMYLPEPQNDFIFAVLAEELGFFGAAVAIALFAVLLWRGIKVAMMSNDPFGCYLAVGITAHITIQALANIAVVTASIPATGVSLPFFSSGGTSLCIFLAEVGILLNVSKNTHVDTVLPANDVSAAVKYQTLADYN